MKKKKKSFKLLSMKFSILVCPTTNNNNNNNNESMIMIFLKFINFNSMVFSLKNSFSTKNEEN